MIDFSLREALLLIQHCISTIGVLIIFVGILLAFVQFFYFVFSGQLVKNNVNLNRVRLQLGRVLLLGLEFIVAADLIGSTTTPDYYSLGILAIIVLIRTLLSYTINREIMELSKEP